MNESEIYQKMTPIFQEIFEEDDLVPVPNMTAHDVEEWDSLNHIRLIIAVEEFFNIKLSSAEVGNLKNVADFVSVIKTKTAL